MIACTAPQHFYIYGIILYDMEDISNLPVYLRYFTTSWIKSNIGNEYDLFILKELVDNALDKGARRISIRIGHVDRVVLGITVLDDGEPRIDDRYVGSILDVRNITSSKYAIKRVKRGMLGNAIICCFGLSYILWNARDDRRYTCKIHAVDKDHLVRFRIEKDVVVERISVDSSNGMCGFTFFIPAECYSGNERILNIIDDFHILNPSVDIELHLNGKPYHFKAIMREDDSVYDLGLNPGLNLNNSNNLNLNNNNNLMMNHLINSSNYDKGLDISLYSYEEFNDLLLVYRERSIKDLVALFRGLKGRRKVKALLAALNIDKDTRVEDIRNSSGSGGRARDLYNMLNRFCSTIKPRNLPRLTHLKHHSDTIKYSVKYVDCRYRNNRYVAVVECILLLKKGKKEEGAVGKRIVEAINFSPTLSNTFTRYASIMKVVEGLDRVLPQYRLIIHLVTPTIVYNNTAKSEIEIGPFFDAIYSCLKSVRRGVRRKRDGSMDYATLIERVNSIINHYREHGNTRLTLRQIFYRLVSLYNYPNTRDAYNRLSRHLTEARDDGCIDEECIVDLSRPEYRFNPEHQDAEEYISNRLESMLDEFDLDRWEGQDKYVEVWIEKEALAGVIAPICKEYRVRLVVCKGYSSYTQKSRAMDRFPAGKDRIVILYMGDHDPTGMNIEEVLKDDLRRLAEKKHKDIRLEVKRVAITDEQISRYSIPPYYLSKQRVQGRDAYISRYGHNVWELDALDPGVLTDTLKHAIEEHIDMDRWRERSKQIEEERSRVAAVIEKVKYGMKE